MARGWWIGVGVVAVAMVAVVVIGVYLFTGRNVLPTEPGAEQERVAPLTGEPLKKDEKLDHPAVAIKFSDVKQAHPHTGLDRADIVFAQPIGVSYTRLAAVFHRHIPKSVGPVRSVRPADAPLLGPIAPVFGHTMAADWVMAYVSSVANVDSKGSLQVRDSDAYTRDPDRPRPDDVFVKPQVLLDLSDRTAPPRPYFAYADPEKARKKGEGVTVSYGPDWDVRWTYDKGRYLRDEPWGPHMTTGGKQISAENVVVIEVNSEVKKIGEGGGAPVPVLDLVDGSGKFRALSGGKTVTGTWSKGAVNDPFTFRTDAGEELHLARGNTWVELPRPGDVS